MVNQKTWRQVRCGDVIDVRDGTHDTPPKVAAGFPLITSKNLVNGSLDFSDVTYISEQSFREVEKRSRVDDGDIVMAMIGTIGSPVLVKKDRDFAIKNVALFKLPPAEVYAPYFLHLLNSEIVASQLLRNSRGGNQKFVSLRVLRDLQIPLPPLSEQKRIAAILDQAEELRAKRRAAIALLDELTQSIFLDMFGDPFGKDVHTVELCTIADVVMGTSPRGDSYNDKGVGMPLLNGPTEFGIKHPTEKQWTTEPTRVCRAGDILFCVRGATAGRLNRSDKTYCIGRGLAAIRPKLKARVGSEFILAVLKRYYQYFQNKGVGSTFISINRPELEKLPIPAVKVNDALGFTKRMQQIEQLETAMRTSTFSCDTLFSSLQHRAFRGEL